MTVLVFGSAEAAKVLAADKLLRRLEDAVLCQCGGEAELITVKEPVDLITYYVRCGKCKRFALFCDYEGAVEPDSRLDIGDAVDVWNDLMEVM